MAKHAPRRAVFVAGLLLAAFGFMLGSPVAGPIVSLKALGLDSASASGAMFVVGMAVAAFAEFRLR